MTTMPANPTPAITMQDVRLFAGEGTLSAATVLQAVNAILAQRSERAIPAEGVVVPLELLQRAHTFIEDCAFNGELQPTSDSENPCELATDLAAMLAARPAAPTQSAAQMGEVDEAAIALLKSIDEMDPHQEHCSTVAYVRLRQALSQPEARR